MPFPSLRTLEKQPRYSPGLSGFLRCFFLLSSLLTSWFLAAQGPCNSVFTVGPDTAICGDGSALLTGTPGFETYLWSTGATTQSITVSTTGTYTCTATELSSVGNVVINGDFSQGDTGFSSDYLPGIGGTYGLLSLAGRYAVAPNAHNTHVNFASFWDHTTGTNSGNMLVVNGAGVANQSIWCQTVAVVPNTTYTFQAWLASCVSGAPAVLDFTVNGVSLGNPLLATSQTGVWLPFNALWDSGNNTSVTICITNLNTANAGNDFALDDIVFSPACTYTDSVVVSLNPFPQPDLGPDITICDGDPVVLQPNWPSAQSYLWSDGSTGPTLQPQVSGTNWVQVSENGCSARDSIDVTFNPFPVVDLGPDQTLCAGETTTLNATHPGASYLWQDGSTAATYTTTVSVNASVAVTVLGCSTTDAAFVHFNPLPLVDLGADALTCADSVLQFNMTQPGGSYLWDDGDTIALHSIADAGGHWLRVAVLGCISADTMRVDRILPIELDLGPDFLLCSGTTATLVAGPQPGPGLYYRWDDGSTDITRQIDDEGNYSVLVGNVCETVMDTVVVTMDLCDCPVFVPNAFTPDGDDLNDVFAPTFDCPVDRYHFTVFNRWGSPVWSSDDPTKGWDGGTGKDQAPEGVYIWLLQVTPHTVYEHTPRRVVGHVVVLR